MDTVTKVVARAQRSGEWWAIDVPELPGLFTQVKRLDQVAAMVQDAAEGLGFGEVEVNVEPHLSDQLDADVEAVRQAQEEAARAARIASVKSRETVSELRAAGLTVRDVARLLGVSAQRVSQLG